VAVTCSQSAIGWAGITRVVYGTSIPTLTSFGWHQIQIRAAEVAAQTPFVAIQVKGVAGFMDDLRALLMGG
jgi:tRNA(Arg) A34 adenosine deaminase TadA